MSECKSVDFVVNRISSGQCLGISEIDLTNISVYKFSNILNGISDEAEGKLNDNTLELILENETQTNQVILNIVYNPDCDFDYFTMESCVCDGTLSFMEELIYNIFCKLVEIKTVNKETVPNNLEKNIFDYNVTYTVGEFVIFTENGDFGTEEKPWLNSKFTVMLPLKCEFIMKV